MASAPRWGVHDNVPAMDDAELRERNISIVSRYLDAINRSDLQTQRELFAEDAVFEMPYAPDGFERRFVGRDNIIAFLETVLTLTDAENLHDIRLETYQSDPGEVIAEFKSDMVMKPTGAAYRNEYLARFTVRDGKITRFAEYYDPIRLVVALGGSVHIAGNG
jgi:ketosteroid isomerase-like protein